MRDRLTDVLPEHVEWCKRKRAFYGEQLERLEARHKSRSFETRSTARGVIEEVETSDEATERVKADIAALDRFLAEYDPAS
jgi:hypothetical protein